MALILSPKHPLLSLSLKLAELCKPIEPFGIHHFTYQKQLKNGRRISLSNKPAWIEDYYNLHLYESSLFEEPFDLEESRFNLWFDDYELEVYQHGKLYYNTMHSISIIEQKKGYSEAYLFATTPDNPQAIHFLSNHREILYHFILYLKDRGKLIFKEAEENSILIPREKKSANEEFWFKSIAWNEDLKQKTADFFNKTAIRQFNFSDENMEGIHLTQREITCIFHLLNYKTATETAKLMNISQRTVESYLETIKNKFSANTKAELIQKINESPYWRALF
jgi:DNA-binding CsgD family transcriptional regulator